MDRFFLHVILIPWSWKRFLSAFIIQLSALISLFAADDAATITRKALQASPPGNWTLSGVLSTRVSERSRPGHLISGERMLTIEFQQLENGTRQVIYRFEGKDGISEGIRVLLPGNNNTGLKLFSLATETPIKELKASFFGSLFNVEDVSMRFLAWKTQELMGEETFKDRLCWKIASHPAKSDVTSYARVESWIDKEYQALLKAVAYDEKGQVLKEFNVRSFHQLEDTWMLKHLDLDAPVLKARSRLEILGAKKKE